jgi:SAM-dependent methyltransferase
VERDPLLTLGQWHERYRQQAGWTAELRRYILSRLKLDPSARVLEVGCGTGAVLAQVGLESAARLHGLDIDLPALGFAGESLPSARLVAGDAAHLPYAPASFDLVYCHYLLLWVKDAARAVTEMRRVTRPGGAVVLLAEPDYGGRIDYPQELEILGRWQIESLQSRGANIRAGRRLSSLLAESGLQQVEYGVLGGAWTSPPSSGDWKLEWRVLRDDLAGLVSSGEISRMRLDQLQNIDRQAWQRGERVLFVPTFYAWGRVPD